jgi:hypothetical protein
VGPEQILWDSAQRPRQTLIRVPIVVMGSIVMAWRVDGIVETIAQVERLLYASFRWMVSKKVKNNDDGPHSRIEILVQS